VIVVTRVGLGKAGLAHAELCFSQDSQGLVFSDDYCFPPFVAYQMRFLVSIFKHISRGTTISGVTKKQLLDLSFKLPPYREQHRIVAEIETQFTRLDAVVTAFKRVQANLKRYRASVLQAACTGRLVPTEAELARAEGRSYESADQLLQRILQERRAQWEAEQLAAMKAEGKTPKDDWWKSKYREPVQPDTSRLPELPEGWEWATVEQLGTIGEQPVLTGPFGTSLGREDFISSGVPVLTIGCLTNTGITLDKSVFVSQEKAASLSRYRLKPGDLLFSRMASVGRAGIVGDSLAGALINYHIMRLRLADNALVPGFYMAYVRGSTQVENYIREVNHGATRDGINTEQLLAMPVALPPLAEQHRIVAEVERRLSVIDELEATITTNLKRTDRLRQAILKRAFEGKLVPQDPTDEPASVLLERIRMEREYTMVKPKATPRQTNSHKSTVEPKAATPIQGELALEFRE
jgi:type I restriction enzyme S subunit